MADVTISATMHGTAYGTAFQNTTYWTSPTVGYTFGIDSGFDFVYWKTSDAGANWSSTPIDIKAATCVGFAIWAKEWTTGDKTDTIVHTWYLDQAAETIHYRSLDTSSDTLGTERSVKVVTSISTGSAPADRSVSGIETQGGNLLLAWRVDPDGEHGLARSIDSGANWTDRTDIFDGDGDICLLTPGNVSAGDTADCWGFYIDATANELSLKEYDDSGNSFNETAIATVVENFGGAWNLGAAYRQSDDHTIVAAWDEFDSATAELKVWDVASNASITAKTSIVAAGADQAEAIECPVFINQQNDYIYIAYISGGTWGSLEDVHYQVSRDGGASWDGEVSMSVDTQDDHRNVWSGNSVGDNGGMFAPTWFNDDLNDLFFNADNAVSIGALQLGTGTVMLVPGWGYVTVATDGDVKLIPGMGYFTEEAAPVGGSAMINLAGYGGLASPGGYGMLAGSGGGLVR